MTKQFGSCLYASVACALLATASQAAQVINYTNGHRYEAIEARGISWEEARAAAEARGGYLATITNEAENDFVHGVLLRAFGSTSVDQAWLGGYQTDKSQEPGGNWRWVTDEPWSYTNWLEGEPNDGGGIEDHLTLNALGQPKWNDEGSWIVGVRGYIIEYPYRDAISYAGGPVTEDFTGLESGQWVNGITRPGWYAFKGAGNVNFFNRADGEWAQVGSAYVGNSGESISGGEGYLVNFRGESLGTFPLQRDVTFALALKNTSGKRFHCFALGFYGEQWRITTCCGATSSMEFSYGIASTLTSGQPNGVANPSTFLPHQADKPDDFNNGYMRVPELDVKAVRLETTHQALNGNRPENRRRHFHFAENLTWEPGQYLILRWFSDWSTEKVSQLLAVDDLRFRAGAEGQVEVLAVEPVAPGQMQLLACGIPGAQHTVEESDDLREWMPVGQLSSATGKLVYPFSVTEAKRFYRVVQR